MTSRSLNLRKLATLTVVIALGLVLTIALITPSSTVEAQTFTGSNWQGQYYGTTTFTNLLLNRVDPQISFNFGEAGFSGGPADNFSIRWSGQQNFTQGFYNFTLFLDNNANGNVRIDGVNVLTATPGQGQNVVTNVFVTGGPRLVEVDYIDTTGDSLVQFSWTAVSQTGGATPTPQPSPTVTSTSLPPIPPGAITATVIRASVLNVRAAPSLGGDRLGTILRGQTYAIVGRDENARWFLLQLSNYQGWAWGYYLFVNGNEFTPPVRSPFGTLGVPPGVVDTGVVGQSEATLRLRAGPSVATAQIGRVTWGGFLPISARTGDGFWYKVVWKGTVGWVYSPFVNIIQGDINAVPFE